MSTKIQTPRLTLRELSMEDLKPMTEICLDPEVTTYIDYIKFDTQDQVSAWLRDKIEHNNKTPRHAYNFAILEKDTGEMVGWIGVGKPSSPNKGDLDFGYALNKKYWGKGYASEALKSLIDFCFVNLKVQKITGECDARNTSSERVMLKVGMYLDKTSEKDGKVTKRFAIDSGNN